MSPREDRRKESFNALFTEGVRAAKSNAYCYLPHKVHGLGGTPALERRRTTPASRALGLRPHCSPKVSIKPYHVPRPIAARKHFSASERRRCGQHGAKPRGAPSGASAKSACGFGAAAAELPPGASPHAPASPHQSADPHGESSALTSSQASPFST